jgi:hypothetical protein
MMTDIRWAEFVCFGWSSDHCQTIHRGYWICNRGRPARLEIRNSLVLSRAQPHRILARNGTEIKTEYRPTLSCVCANGTIQTGGGVDNGKGKAQPTTRRKDLSPTKHQTDITRRLAEAEADAGLVEQQLDCLEEGRRAG